MNELLYDIILATDPIIYKENTKLKNLITVEFIAKNSL